MTQPPRIEICGIIASSTADYEVQHIVPAQKKRWDIKAFFQLPLWFCRWIFVSEKLKCTTVIKSKFFDMMRPRRAYCNGVRYAMCDTRVI